MFVSCLTGAKDIENATLWFMRVLC